MILHRSLSSILDTQTWNLGVKLEVQLVFYAHGSGHKHWLYVVILPGGCYGIVRCADELVDSKLLHSPLTQHLLAQCQICMAPCLAVNNIISLSTRN